MARVICCRECSKTLEAGRRASAEFCGMDCRIAWRNRRATRGAELYDLFMAIRFERGPAKLYGLWNLMCRMASAWMEEDRAAGRKSYFPPEEARSRCLKYVATVYRN